MTLSPFLRDLIKIQKDCYYYFVVNFLSGTYLFFSIILKSNYIKFLLKKVIYILSFPCIKFKFEILSKNQAPNLKFATQKVFKKKWLCEPIRSPHPPLQPSHFAYIKVTSLLAISQNIQQKGKKTIKVLETS